MATYTLSPNVKRQFLDGSGNPLSSGKLYTVTAGGSYPGDAVTVYQTSSGTAHTNPIVLDSAGRISGSSELYLEPGQSYKFILTTSADVAVWTQDNVGAVPLSTVNEDITGLAGVALAEGDCVYLSDGSGSLTAGSWYKADADLTYASTLPVIGFAVAAIASGATGTIRRGGQITLSSLSPGSTYYVSATAGGLTTTAPTNAREVGKAQSTTVLDIDIKPAQIYSLSLTSTGASALDVAGGINAGSGNVGIVDTAGKIPALNSTYLASVAGTSLTGIPVLLYANSGSSTNAAAENVDTYALASQLTAKDRLLVYYGVQSVTQQTASVILQNSTDTVTIIDVWDSGGGALPAGRNISGVVTLQQLQSAATAVGALNVYGTNVPSAVSLGLTPTFTTNWTGAWTIALRQGGVTAGGTFRWSWSIYRVQGQ